MYNVLWSTSWFIIVIPWIRICPSVWNPALHKHNSVHTSHSSAKNLVSCAVATVIVINPWGNVQKCYGCWFVCALWIYTVLKAFISGLFYAKIINLQISFFWLYSPCVNSLCTCIYQLYMWQQFSVQCLVMAWSIHLYELCNCGNVVHKCVTYISCSLRLVRLYKWYCTTYVAVPGRHQKIILGRSKSRST